MNLKQRKSHMYHCVIGDTLRFVFDKGDLTHTVIYIEELLSECEWKNKRSFETSKTLIGKVDAELFSHTVH